MLILTRKPGESLYIDHVKVTIVEIKGHQIRIGIDAPKEIRIYREEIYLQILEENKKAAEAAQTSTGGLEGLTEAWSKRGPTAESGPAALSGSSSGSKSGEGEASKPQVRGPGLSAFTTSVGAGKLRPVGPGMNGPQVVMKKKKKPSNDE